MSLTTLFRPFFDHHYRKILPLLQQADDVQRNFLKQILGECAHTEYGQQHQFADIRDYESFARQVPINTYEDMKGYIDRMRHGEKDVLCPGAVKWYAKSSGTTNDKSKYLPVSKVYLHDTHYNGARACVAFYLQNHPESRLFDGRSLILGGSHVPNYDVPESLVGDLSAILIENTPDWVNKVRVPCKQTALMGDFESKRMQIAKETPGKRVTNLSGVPSWMLSVLHCTLEQTGAKYVTDVWPHLEAFFHGGVAFTPYREAYNAIIPEGSINYMETYNASEGFFGIQSDPNDRAMLLMTQLGIFYEFIPLEEVGKEHPEVVPLWGVETNRNYAIVISNHAGLWRYQIGDTVRFTSVRPYKFVITGRTKSFINAFGEELIVDNAEVGLQAACAATGAEVLEYTAAPIFMDENAKCRHQWVIEFAKNPDSIEHFALVLDQTLQQINSDYEAKRSKNITLQPLEIVVAREGLFNDWLKSEGKLGGQHKVPRLCNDRKIIEKVLKLNA